MHQNADLEAEYAPSDIDEGLVSALCSDARTPCEKEGGYALNAEDVARCRVRREKESPPLDSVHAEIARGEMAIALGVFGGLNGAEDGIPLEWLKEWIRDERMPQGWKPTHSQGLLQTVKTSSVIRKAMEALLVKQDRDEKEQEEENVLVIDAGSDTSSSNGDSLFSPRSQSFLETTPLTSDDEGEILARKDDVLEQEY